MSSSSSECGCEDCWFYDNYNRNYGNAFGENPFHTTMGHPLIYYAQVPQPIGMRPRGRQRRRNSPNCFVKAFRWYTQEHVPKRTEAPAMSPNMSGFASWLDEKYKQYLLEAQMDSNLLHLRMKQTAVIETEGISSDCCEPRTTNRFRVRSPWNKKRHTRSNEVDGRIRSTHSFQILLQPKNLSGHTSECCRSSTATIKSEYQKRATAKSQSCTNISLKSREPVDFMLLQEGASSALNCCQRVCRRSGCQSSAYKDTEVKSTDVIKVLSNVKVASQDFACQFPAEKIIRVNAGTQYNADPMPSSAAEVASCSCDLKPADCACPLLKQKSAMKVQNTPSNFQKPYPIIEPKEKYFYCECAEQSVLQRDVQTQTVANEALSACNMHSTCCGCEIKEIAQSYALLAQNMSSNKRCICAKQPEDINSLRIPITLSHETAQTSDYAICFEKNSIREYPLFMKIVCADKLSKENVE